VKKCSQIELTPEPTGEIWHPNLNLSGFGGFRCPSGFANEFLSEFFLFLSGFEFFSSFFEFLSSFFGFQVHPQVKNETHTQIWFCAGKVWIRVIDAKIHPNSHPSDTKPTDYLKSVWIRVIDAKIHPNSHPLDTKPTDYLKSESELQSLVRKLLC
jgi:hypothetical protein